MLTVPLLFWIHARFFYYAFNDKVCLNVTNKGFTGGLDVLNELVFFKD